MGKGVYTKRDRGGGSEGLWSGAPGEPVDVCKVNGLRDCWVS